MNKYLDIAPEVRKALENPSSPWNRRLSPMACPIRKMWKRR